MRILENFVVGICGRRAAVEHGKPTSTRWPSGVRAKVGKGRGPPPHLGRGRLHRGRRPPAQDTSPRQGPPPLHRHGPSCARPRAKRLCEIFAPWGPSTCRWWTRRGNSSRPWREPRIPRSSAKRSAISSSRYREREVSRLGIPDAFLAQGTLYTDLIESGKGVGSKAQVIKSHHNVRSPLVEAKRKAGRVIEPLDRLYKDEVRSLGRLLGVSEDVVRRHPFPGRASAWRILGEVTKEKCDLLPRGGRDLYSRAQGPRPLRQDMAGLFGPSPRTFRGRRRR